MGEEINANCARPTGSREGAPAADHGYPQEAKEEPDVILIGKKVPDFTVPGYHQGKFVNVKLSEYLGKWVLVHDSQGTLATPSGWRPGRPTLRPGPALVGNVWKEWKTESAF